MLSKFIDSNTPNIAQRTVLCIMLSQQVQMIVLTERILGIREFILIVERISSKQICTRFVDQAERRSGD
jgi:hypothetical protein